MMKLTQFLQEGDGTFSSTRLGFLIWVVGLLVVWVLVSAQTLKLEPIDNSIITLIGILMTGKVVQRYGENDSSQQTPTSGASAGAGTGTGTGTGS